jgi:hypothetical protein
VLVTTRGAALIMALLQGYSRQHAPLVEPVPAADSQRIVRRARSAQIEFEAFRRARLPLGFRSSEPCEIRVGRYCYWRGDEGDEKPPPPELPAIRERRDALIRMLDSASGALPGDGWIAGQVVRYLVEIDSTDAAMRAARETCRAGSGWCHALAGYAAHSGSRFAVADSEFNLALAAMEPSERCRWLDISDLITDDLAHRFAALDCPSRQALARRAMRAGAPMFSISDSDLWTEHLARYTRARIAEHSSGPDGETWADDERQLMMRYGWPRWYSRTEPSFGSTRPPSVIGHDTGMPYNFFPTLVPLDHIGLTTQNDWKLDEPGAATGYAPAYMRTLHDLPSQIARFRRGDSTLVVAAWDARRDTTLIGRALQAALVVWSDDSTRAISRNVQAHATGTIVTTAVLDSGLVSLELLASEGRHGARARVGIAPRDTGRVTVSDVLLYVPTSGASDRLDAVSPDALTSDVVPASRALGVYWELYGLRPSGESVRYTLTIEQIGVSWMRRAAERLHFSDPTTGLRIQWEEVPQRTDGVAGRGVRVDLSRLRTGRYRMQVAIAAAGQSPTTATREIEVR